MPATGHPADPLRQGRGVTGSDMFPQTCTAHRSHYTDWNNRIEYHGFAAVGSIYKTAFHGPSEGDRATLDAQSAECRLRPPMGLKVAARTAFANAGSMRAAGWIAQHMEREPGSIQAEVC